MGLYQGSVCLTQGKTGKSAYQYAVEGGYEGTETEYKVLMANASKKSVSESATLLSANWSSGQYILSNNNITAMNIVEMYPATTITTDQLKAVQKANIIGGSQNTGSLALVAKGTIPVIDIPVIFVYRGDM